MKYYFLSLYRFNNLFASDCEEELTSVVSDIPNLHYRSPSAVGSFGYP